MNRIQFFVLTGLSTLVVLLLAGNILLSRQVAIDQGKFSQAQQAVQQGQVFQGDLKQLAVRIFSDSQKTQDPALKELLQRNQITYTPNSPEANGSSSNTGTSSVPAPLTK
jgi:hypothetical protein